MIPIVLFFYKRLNTTKRVWETIQRRKPSKLYLIADGPKNITEKSECNDVKNYIENNISWDCDIIRIYSKKILVVPNVFKVDLIKFLKMKKWQLSLKMIHSQINLF